MFLSSSLLPFFPSSFYPSNTGIEAYLDTLIDAPKRVLDALCAETKMHQMMVGDAKAQRKVGGDGGVGGVSGKGGV